MKLFFIKCFMLINDEKNSAVFRRLYSFMLFKMLPSLTSKFRAILQSRHVQHTTRGPNVALRSF